MKIQDFVDALSAGKTLQHTRYKLVTIGLTASWKGAWILHDPSFAMFFDDFVVFEDEIMCKQNDRIVGIIEPESWVVKE